MTAHSIKTELKMEELFDAHVQEYGNFLDAEYEAKVAIAMQQAENRWLEHWDDEFYN